MNRAPEIRIYPDEIIVDSFAGGGGASFGIEMALGRSPDIAINHDAEAIAMHARNHPGTKHYCEDVWKVSPREAVAGRKVGLMWLSPDCKHFSKAKGGKPVEKKIRGLAWVAYRWAKEVRPRMIALENVEEFVTWGPLGKDGKPCALRKGFTFRRFVAMLSNLGYTVDWRELVAADYGAPTTRKRLFLVARCDGVPIAWPEPTHSKDGRFLPRWRAAAECIDFTLPCPSIFLTPEEARKVGVKRPLAENTMRRIARGLQKFVIDNPKPFIVGLAHGEHTRGAGLRAHGTEEPMRTVQAQGGNQALVAPLVAKFRGDSAGASIESPLPTITAGPKENPAGAAHALGVVAPVIARISQTGGNGGYANDVRDPLTTLVSKNEHLLVAPYTVPRYGEREGQEPRAMSLEQPSPTIVPDRNGAQLVAAFMAKHNGGHEATGQVLGRPIDTITGTDQKAIVAVNLMVNNTGHPGSAGGSPAATITSGGHHGVVTSNLVKLKGTAKHGTPADAPLPTVQAGGNHYAEVRAFLMKYHATGGQWNTPADPMPTVVATDSIGLVTVHDSAWVIVDIGMRMLQPRELYRAQGFPDTYQIDFNFKGKPLPKDAQVRMVGNSVCPPVAAAIIRANLGAREEREFALAGD